VRHGRTQEGSIPRIFETATGPRPAGVSNASGSADPLHPSPLPSSTPPTGSQRDRGPQPAGTRDLHSGQGPPAQPSCAILAGRSRRSTHQRGSIRVRDRPAAVWCDLSTTYGVPYVERQAALQRPSNPRQAWTGEPFSHRASFYGWTNATVATASHTPGVPHQRSAMAATSEETFPAAGRLGLTNLHRNAARPRYRTSRPARALPDAGARRATRDGRAYNVPDPVYGLPTEAGAREEPRESLTSASPARPSGPPGRWARRARARRTAPSCRRNGWRDLDDDIVASKGVFWHARGVHRSPERSARALGSTG